MRLLCPLLLALLCAGCDGLGFYDAKDAALSPDAGVTWLELWGQADSDTRGQAIAADPQGGFVFSGVFAMGSRSQLGVQRNQENGGYVMMVATDLTCPAGPCALDVESAVAVGDNGAAYAVASFQGPGVLPLRTTQLDVPAGVTAGLVQKLDAAQRPLWTVPLGGSAGLLRPDDLAVLPEGGAVLVGAFHGEQTFGSMTLGTGSVLRAFVARIDAEGAFLWVRMLGALGPEERVHVAVSGGAIAVAERDNGMPCITWYTPSGDWKGATGFSAATAFADVAPLPGGGVVVAGRRAGNPAPSFITALEASHLERWTLTTGAQVSSLATNAQTVLVGGDARGAVELGGKRYEPDAPFASVFVARVSLAGEPLSLQRFGAQAEGELTLRASALLRDGSSVHAGSASAPVRFGEDHAGGGPRPDAFFFKLAP